MTILSLLQASSEKELEALAGMARHFSLKIARPRRSSRDFFLPGTSLLFRQRARQ
jgi:hypothetical protein